MPRPQELVDTITALIDKAGVGQSAGKEFLNQAPIAPPVTRARGSTVTPKQAPVVKGLPTTGARGGPTPGTLGQMGANADQGTAPSAPSGGISQGASTVNATSEIRGPATGYTDAEAREITRTLVGREMGLNDLESWVAAFTREHGATPWQTGPFDQTNNFVDHLLALGESEREVAMGGGSQFTKAGREGNPMAQPAITPDFWANAYYNRYTGPTYTVGPSGPIWMGSQSLLPGEMPPTNAPSELGYYGSMLPRPYYEYMPAMNPGAWPSQAPEATALGFTAPLWPTPTGGPSQYWR